MPKYVLGPDAVVHLAELEAAIGDERELLAPTLMRSQVLSMLYHSAHEGEVSRAEADRRLTYVRGLRIRLWGTASSSRLPGRSPTSSGGPTR